MNVSRETGEWVIRCSIEEGIDFGAFMSGEVEMAPKGTRDALADTVDALVLYVKLDNDKRAGCEIVAEDWAECHGAAEPALGKARAILDAARD